jgi:hypothetical protein
VATGALGSDCPAGYAPKQLEQREVFPEAVEKALCITYGRFRQIAKQRDWSIEWLVKQVKGELDKPIDELQLLFIN